VIKAEVVAHTKKDNHAELITFKVTYPRVILAEVNTHRMFSRNTSSSRAIPVERRLESVRRDPWIPLLFGSNRPGMSSGEKLADDSVSSYWVGMVDIFLDEASQFMKSFNVHKEVTNRIFESFSHVTQVVTTGKAGLQNFFDQRLSKGVQPEMAALALRMWKAYKESVPSNDTLHVPFRKEVEKIIEPYKKASSMEGDSNFRSLQEVNVFDHVDLLTFIVSTALCAKVSYDREDQTDLHISKYVKICLDMAKNRHYSPFEHCAYFMADVSIPTINIPDSWVSFRWLVQNRIEANALKPEEERAKEIEEWLGIQ